MPYDLTRENYTAQLWALEGITSYYDDLTLVRCGLIGASDYLELIGRSITTLRTPGRAKQRVAESSFEAIAAELSASISPRSLPITFAARASCPWRSCYAPSPSTSTCGRGKGTKIAST